MRVFNSCGPSNRITSIDKCYAKHEREKKRAYRQREGEIEHDSFTPLVLSTSGGFTMKATIFYKPLASKLVSNWDQSHSIYHLLYPSYISYSVCQSGQFPPKPHLQEFAWLPRRHISTNNHSSTHLLHSSPKISFCSLIHFAISYHVFVLYCMVLLYP